MNRFEGKDISGCATTGIMDESGQRFSGKDIIDSIAVMHERSNGLGGGFAAYGIYPDHANDWCFHLMYDDISSKEKTEERLQDNFKILKSEKIPIREEVQLKYKPLLWRYFMQSKIEKINLHYNFSEEDFIVDLVMNINAQIKGAFIFSSGKNMGVFKGVGYPEDIGNFFKLEEYNAYTWTAHGRFPTNTGGWWGGAHPFSLLDWTVVHNGEISSYGINRKFLLNYGYKCSFYTDTEVIVYLFDLLIRKHDLPFSIVANILAAPFWEEIEEKQPEEREVLESLRMVYAGALLNGPFSVIVANTENMIGLNDRIKLRPLVASVHKSKLYIASEEAAIREVCPHPEKVWRPKAGEPIIGKLGDNHG